MGIVADISGRRFGRLVAVEHVGFAGHHATWLCKCDCGQDKITPATLLKTGKVQSCGCYRKDVGRAKRMDITGQRYNRLSVVKFIERRNGHSFFRCRCDCGNVMVATLNSLRNGNTQSCGCLHRERTATHGLSHTAEYDCWTSMIQRCYNPKNTNYRRYGARGIVVCTRWRDSFEHFIADMGRRPSRKHSIEREDNSGDYSPENCKWATRRQQLANRRCSRTVEYRGQTMLVSEFGRLIGRNKSTVYWHLSRGRTGEEIAALVMG
jgi:hypothetical protein